MLSPRSSKHPAGLPASVAPVGSSPYESTTSGLANFGTRAQQNGHHTTGMASSPVNAVMSSQGFAVSMSSPSSPGRGLFEEHRPQAVVEGEATASTFHLPTGLAEQLSDCPQIAPCNGTAPHRQSQAPAQAAAYGQHAVEHVRHQQPAQHVSFPGSLSGNGVDKAKLHSPPGFSRPLDGAAKPFVPSNAPWSQHAGNPGRQYILPPSVAATAAGPSQPPANLASGQWAMTNGVSIYPGTAHAGSPFNHATRYRSTSDADSSDSWQVPAAQPQVLQRGDVDSASTLNLLDIEHDNSSGLAPHMVLDYLGIGLSDEQTSSVSQSVT